MLRHLHADSCKIAEKWREVQKLFLHLLKGCGKFDVSMHCPSTAFHFHAIFISIVCHIQTCQLKQPSGTDFLVMSVHIL